MATFTFKSFGQLLQDMVDTMTANASNVINFGEGSVVRVLFEAVAGRLDYFTILLKRILLLCRLATSVGEDVDSFSNDYGMDARLPAVSGKGTVTLTRFSVTSNPIRIPIGSTILANDDSVTYEVIADPSNVNYNSSEQAYFIASNQPSVDVTAEAQTSGTIGNVGANTLNVIGSSLAGVDEATNAVAVTNAVDAETDAQMRARFILYINTRARATKAALEYAIEVVQNGLVYRVEENIDILGNEQLGHVCVVIDDGSGSPPSALLDGIRTSIDSYRAFTVDVDVYGPTLLTTNASCTVTVESGYDATLVKSNVQTAITNHLNNKTFGEFMAVNKLADLAFDVAGVRDVEVMHLNGGTTDVSPAFNEIIKAGTVTIS